MTQKQENLVKTYFAQLWLDYTTASGAAWDAAFARLISKSNFKRACREFSLIAETEEAVALLWDYSSTRELKKLAVELEAE